MAATDKQLLAHYKEQCELYEEYLDWIRHKCKDDWDLEHAVRPVMRRYAKARNRPMPGTAAWREINGIPFGDE